MENDTIFYLYLTYGMPQSLKVFVDFNTLERLNFGTLGVLAHPPPPPPPKKNKTFYKFLFLYILNV